MEEETHEPKKHYTAAKLADSFEPKENVISIIHGAIEQALREADRDYIPTFRKKKRGAERDEIFKIASDLQNIEDHIVPAILLGKYGTQPDVETEFLDIGSGTGIVTLYFALRFGIYAQGVEIDKLQYDIAEKLRLNLEQNSILKPGQVSFIYGDMSQVDFSKYHTIYYHSPLIGTEFDRRVFQKVVHEMRIGSQFISTLRTIPDDIIQDIPYSHQEISSGDDLITIIYANIYTKEASPNQTEHLISRQSL